MQLFAAAALITLTLSGSIINAQTFLPFPAEIQGGIEGLRAWIKAEKLTVVTADDVLELKPREFVYTIFHASGSGLNMVDAYIYGCLPDGCSLFALRRGIALPKSPKSRLIVRLDRSKTALELVSNDRELLLRIPLPRDQLK